MIIRVLPIHVPPCYDGGYLKPTPLKPCMTYDDHLVWPIHVPRRCEPLITPHLSLWGNARTRASFPTHKKSHNPHPQGGGGKGVKMGTLHWGGGGGACQTWIIYDVFNCCIEQPAGIANIKWPQNFLQQQGDLSSEYHGRVYTGLCSDFGGPKKTFMRGFLLGMMIISGIWVSDISWYFATWI